MLASVATLAGGCGYTSKYAPPADGRARAVWRDNAAVVALAGSPTEACMAEVMRVSGTDRLALGAPQGIYPPSPSGGWWAPRYYGPRIVVVSPHLAPPMPVAPMFTPRPVTIGAPSAAKGFVSTGSSGGFRMPNLGGGGGGGGKGFGEVLVVIAVIALIVLPAIDLGLALADPEDAKASSKAIDQVNVYNDLVRWTGSPCWTMYAPPPEAGEGADVGGAP